MNEVNKVLLIFALIAFIYWLSSSRTLQCNTGCLAENFWLSSFPNVNGMTLHDATVTIQNYDPSLSIKVMAPEDLWTRDFNSNRVRVVVNDMGYVSNQPYVG